MKNYIQALKILQKGKLRIKDEKINCLKSYNRVNSEDIYSKVNYPAANNTSLDGYAIKADDTKNLNKKNFKLFNIIGTISAGDAPSKKRTKKFQTVEIMTGGLIPKGFDTIIPVEEIIFYPNKKKPRFIQINKRIKRYQNVRFKGSDFKKKDLVVKKGTVLSSKHILVFKTLGINIIKVKKIPNILFFSSGKEVTNNNKIQDWKVRNANIHYINSIKNNFLFNLEYGGILSDRGEAVFEKQIKKIFKSKVDMIITSGAVSAGKFDYIPKVIKRFRLSNFFKNVLIRPGKPILFAKIKGKEKALFGLPGNTISSAACFRFFVFPYLRILLGLTKERPIKGILKNSFKKKKKFTHFLKSRIYTTKDGKSKVEILSGQESFRIKPFVNSNIWAVLPSGKSNFRKNDIVDCFYLDRLNKFLI